MNYQTADLDAASEANTISNLNNGPVPDNIAYVEVSGTYGTAVATFQGSIDGTNYANIPGIRTDTLGIETAPTMTDNTTRQWKVDITGMRSFRFKLTSIVSGLVASAIQTTNVPGGISINLQNSLVGNQAFSGTATITSAAAAALTVGPNGATGPGLTVDASTSSAAAGIKITGAASGSGVALVATGGTNESITIDGKGSGTISLNATGTGTVSIGSSLTISAKNIITDTTTGMKIGTATTQKLGFYNSTPVVQPAVSVDVTGFVAGSGTASKSDSVWAGASGATAYTVGGVITALKSLGLLAA